MKLKPLADRVIVKQSLAEEKTATGILLPDSAKEKAHQGQSHQRWPREVG